MSKFEELYRKISTTTNYIQPSYQRMDNWAVDRYEDPSGLFAVMMDSGYSRSVGKRDAEGKVLWRVDDFYPKELSYTGVTKEEFEQL